MKSKTTYQTNQSLKCRSGYTLAQVLSVLVILAILTAIGIIELTGAVTAGLSRAKDGDAKNINEAVVDLMATSAVFTKGDWSCVEGSKSTGATISLPAVADQPSTKAFIRALQRGVPSGGLIISIPPVLDQTKITYYWKQDCPIFHLGE